MDQKFNPQLSDELILVGREAVLDALHADVARFMRSGNPRHILFVGRRGMGKTSLLVALERKHAKEPKLRVVRLPEELYRVTGVDEFFLAVLDAMDVLGERGRAFADQVHDAVGKRRLLVLVDNLDLLFEQLASTQEHSRLRAWLIENPWVMLIATAATPFDAVTSHEQPFFAFFDIRPLSELTMDEAYNLVHRELGKMAPRRSFKSKVAAIYGLAGGAPRTILMLVDAFREQLKSHPPDILSTAKALENVLEHTTPYNKERIEKLPIQQRQIFDALCRRSRAMTPQQIADEVAPEKRLSIGTQLRRMLEAGVVRIRSTRRSRNTYYEPAEPLIALWRRWRLETSAKERLSDVVDVLDGMFTDREIEKDIIDKFQKLSDFTQAGTIAPRDLVLLMSLVADVLEPKEKARTRLHTAIGELRANEPDGALDELKRMSKKGLAELTPAEQCVWHQLRAWIHISQLQPEKALQELDRAESIHKGDRQCETHLARVFAFLRLGRTSEAISEFVKAESAIPPEGAPSLSKLRGIVRAMLGDFAGAKPFLKVAMEKVPDDSARLWSARTSIETDDVDAGLSELENIKDPALAADVAYFRSLGLIKKNNYSEALKHIDSAIGAAGGSTRDLALTRGRLLQWLGRPDEALPALLRSEELTPLGPTVERLMVLWQIVSALENYVTAGVKRDDSVIQDTLNRLLQNPTQTLRLLSTELGGRPGEKALAQIKEALEHMEHATAGDRESGLRAVGILLRLGARLKQVSWLRRLAGSIAAEGIRTAVEKAAGLLEKNDPDALLVLDQASRRVAEEILGLAEAPPNQGSPQSGPNPAQSRIHEKTGASPGM